MGFSDRLADLGVIVSDVLGIDVSPTGPVKEGQTVSVTSVAGQVGGVGAELSSKGLAAGGSALKAIVKLPERFIQFATSLSLSNILLIVSIVLSVIVGLFIWLG